MKFNIGNHSNFYYYDYLFWESIGAKTKYQKKGFLGIWGKTPASEIYIGWGDIVLATDIKGNSLEYPEKLKSTVVQDKVYNKYTKKQENVAYVFGLYLTQEDIDKAVGFGLKSLLTTIRSKTNSDVSNFEKLCVVGPQKYYTIIPHYGRAKSDVAEINETFYYDPTIYFSNDILRRPGEQGGWIKWLAEIIKGYLDMPNTRLICGEIQTAVETPNGEIGAMSIYKPVKK